jgi:ABC-type sugar transport system permease subunit
MKARPSEGLAYLLVGAAVFALTEWLPILHTAVISLQRSNLIRPGSWVGLANYTALLADRVLPTALLNVAALIVVRALVIICVWKILELAWARRQQIPTIFVLIAVAPLPFMTSVGTSVVWRSLGDTDAGGLYNLIAWSSPDRAQVSLYIVDAVHVLAIAAAFGVVIYALAQRTQRSATLGHPDMLALVALADRRYEAERRPAVRALAVTRSIALSIAAATALQSFDWSYTITGGGPRFATMTPVLLVFRNEFQRFVFGPGAALAILLIFMLLIPGCYLWQATRSFQLRLAPLPGADRRPAGSMAGGANALALLSLLPAIIILAPIVEVFRQSELLSRSGLLQRMPWFQWWLNSLVPCGLAIWLIQIPVALATAVGLVTVLMTDPRRGRILLLPFLATSLVGPGVIAGSLFSGLYRLRVLGTQWASTVPLWSNGLTLLVFLLFLVGMRSSLERAWLNGESLLKTVLSDIMPRMRPVILLVGVFNMYWASQSFFWPLITLNRAEHQTASLGLLRIALRGAFLRPVDALLPILPVAAMFAAGFVVCTYWLVTRTALESS